MAAWCTAMSAPVAVAMPSSCCTLLCKYQLDCSRYSSVVGQAALAEAAPEVLVAALAGGRGQGVSTSGVLGLGLAAAGVLGQGLAAGAQVMWPWGQSARQGAVLYRVHL